MFFAATPPPPPPATAIVCVEEGPRVVLTYGTPPDRVASRSDRELARDARRLRRKTSELFRSLTGGYEIRWQCGRPQRMELTPVSQSVDEDNGRYYGKGQAERDAQAAGLWQEDIDHVLLYDSTTAYADVRSNISTISHDSSPGISNANNGGKRTSLVFTWSKKILLHELTHSWGAVMFEAPHYDGHSHCTDGRDIMCYWPTENASCRTLQFDCGRDDYFNPNPPPGSWLESHFNMATDSVWISPPA